MSAAAQSTLFDASAEMELDQMRVRVDLIHKQLIEEECLTPAQTKFKRNRLATSTDELNLEFETRLYHKLMSKLIECRKLKLATRPQQPTKVPTKSKPTAIATSPLQTTTEPATVPITTERMTTATSPSQATTEPATVPTTTKPLTTASSSLPTTDKPPTHTAAKSPTTTVQSITSAATSTPVPMQCVNALNLTESWRLDHKSSNIKPINGAYNSDARDMVESGRPWFRFTGSAGTHILDKCVPKSSCGTYAAMWSNASMPSVIGKVVSILAYGSGSQGCKGRTLKVSVMRCSDDPHDIVYRYDDVSASKYGFCGMTD